VPGTFWRRLKRRIALDKLGIWSMGTAAAGMIGWIIAVASTTTDLFKYPFWLCVGVFVLGGLLFLVGVAISPDVALVQAYASSVTGMGVEVEEARGGLGLLRALWDFLLFGVAQARALIGRRPWLYLIVFIVVVGACFGVFRLLLTS